MVTSSIAAAYIPLILATSAVGAAIIGWWAVAFPRISIWLLFLSLVAGQIIRLPILGQGGGILPSDIAVVLVIGAAVFQWKKYANRQKAVYATLLVAPFIAWSLASLFIQMDSLSFSEFRVAALYWLRTSTYLALFPALLLLFQNKEYAREIRRGLVFAIAALVGLGFLQLLLATDLSFLTKYGWDPHQRRLVSSWLDPNFMGAFLLIGLAWLCGRLVQVKRKSGYTLLAVLSFVALLATQSRSSLVALAVMIAVVLPFFTWFIGRHFARRWQRIAVLVAVANVVLVLFLGAVLLLGNRAGGFVQYDPTVALRAESLSLAWRRIAEPHSVIGVGYNAYQFAAAQSGLIGDFSIHSRAGADNTWLTLWATTGIFGMLLFALPWTAFAVYAGLRFVKKLDWTSGAGALAILGLLVHSQFVNSFLYAHLLIILSLVVVLSISGKDNQTHDPSSAS